MMAHCPPLPYILSSIENVPIIPRFSCWKPSPDYNRVWLYWRIFFCEKKSCTIFPSPLRGDWEQARTYVERRRDKNLRDQPSPPPPPLLSSPLLSSSLLLLSPRPPFQSPIHAPRSQEAIFFFFIFFRWSVTKGRTWSHSKWDTELRLGCYITLHVLLCSSVANWHCTVEAKPQINLAYFNFTCMQNIWDLVFTPWHIFFRKSLI